MPRKDKGGGDSWSSNWGEKWDADGKGWSAGADTKWQSDGNWGWGDDPQHTGGAEGKSAWEKAAEEWQQASGAEGPGKDAELVDGGAAEAEKANGRVPPLKLWVYDRDCGKIIGKGGQFLKDIRSRTGADIKISQRPPDDDASSSSSGSAERMIVITGSLESQQAVQEIILAEVNYLRSEECVLKRGGNLVSSSGERSAPSAERSRTAQRSPPHSSDPRGQQASERSLPSEPEGPGRKRFNDSVLVAMQACNDDELRQMAELLSQLTAESSRPAGAPRSRWSAVKALGAMQDGDLNAWIDSYNQRMEDMQRVAAQCQ